ncbi:glycosyltransferase (GT2) [Formosa agariphila KMM 3901]|uniref:Glycosyltransferase (GT2) n=1 Tax=Formosa agariphila (strain DSM 15362 / KCTC 12365 / LMG 23005 / KMM 3901 / M-2Alg 35-1) TaxID=1347342 RepID=T2KPG1_FORAG|nr:glycosyltransferase [Formosa agariphila]CDF80640.1 glycosyltransferase (GT2) [Formosa agariphila KMM 3901]
MDISVIICCYNSESLLKETLFHVANQKGINDFNYEVILVDNNSKDNTSETARKIWDRYNTVINLKIVKESEPGLAYARKTGVLNSSADILIYCDDDNWLDENYLSISYKFMRDNPEVGALGGQSFGVLEGDEPAWWKEKASGYAVGQQQKNSGDITKRGGLWGAGVVIRKSIILELYKAGFNSLLVGRSGSKISSGDDSELSKWVILMGYKLWYLEELKFKHFIIQKRLTDDYVDKLYQGHFDASKTLRLYNVFIENVKIKESKSSYYSVLVGIYQSLRGVLKKDEFSKILGQIKLGNLYKVHPTIYEMFRVYNQVNKN